MLSVSNLVCHCLKAFKSSRMTKSIKAFKVEGLRMRLAVNYQINQ